MKTAVHRVPGLVLTDMEFRLPLDYARPDGEQIGVFARAVEPADTEGPERPWLVFFQGGPGFPSPRLDGKHGWISRALQDYRVLLLDDRGTGRSTPVTAQTLARLDTPQAQADYVRYFRADSIVQDAEHIRRELAGERVPWAALGQSFGGFCVTHYLSAVPEGLCAAYITGGLPPLDRPVDDIYKATYGICATKNARYYERYPDDVERAHEIVGYLERHEVQLPSKGPLTPRRFQQLGTAFGMSYGFEEVHYLLEDAFVVGRSGREINDNFLRTFEARFSFETNPIYALLHEAEYCQGAASGWSAERIRAEHPEFSLAPDRPVYFTGEMVYPWMFEEYAGLRPLREAAEVLAQVADWPRLYDVETLRANGVPAAAAIYYDDMYVAREYSVETAETIKGLRAWITNEYEHNGLRADGEHLLGRLFDLARGEA